MRRLLLIVGLVAACGKHREHQIDHERAHALFELIPLDAPPGMSGLAVDDHGVMWGIPERDRQLVEIHLGATAATTKRYPITGVPDGVDTEGLAWLGDGHFMISTEGADEATASILFIERRDDGFVVTRTRVLTPAELGVALTVNHGAEGACGAGDDLLVAIEAVGALPDGARYAPIARLHGEALSIYKLRLTTPTGKLSSIDCTIDAKGVAHAWAIERHYGVSRILRFELGVVPGEVVPTLELDLEPLIDDTLNLEGIVRLPDGRLVLINDNQGSRQTGPNELLVLHPR
ncbi:MAG: hypothetical protein JWO36_6090 [Myxococcales bacterium]|nr:hypothetical protein [Myxococcales bacterium]